MTVDLAAESRATLKPGTYLRDRAGFRPNTRGERAQGGTAVHHPRRSDRGCWL